MAKIFHRHAVSAVVGIVDGVQRLMQIPYKVNDITDGFSALQRIGGLVLKDSALLFDGARHTSFRAAVLVQLTLVLPSRNLDVMPGTVLALVSDVIAPRRTTHPHAPHRLATPPCSF